MITRYSYRPRGSAGYMLLEALVAILVFAIGILGVVSLQAVSLRNVGASKYRTDASTLANQLIGRMWASDRNSTDATGANLKTRFQGGFQAPAVSNGPLYTAWLGSATEPGTVLATLPGAEEHRPTVQVTCVPADCLPPPPPATGGGTRRVTVTVRWRLPDEAAVTSNPDAACDPVNHDPQVHCYVAVAEFNASNN